MTEQIERLRLMCNSVCLTEREKQDLRDVCRLGELALAWHADPTQRNIAALSSHIKSLRMP